MKRNKQGQLKDVIKQEYVKCASDPIYYLKRYCMLQETTCFGIVKSIKRNIKLNLKL